MPQWSGRRPFATSLEIIITTMEPKVAVALTLLETKIKHEKLAQITDKFLRLHIKHFTATELDQWIEVSARAMKEAKHVLS